MTAMAHCSTLNTEFYSLRQREENNCCLAVKVTKIYRISFSVEMEWKTQYSSTIQLYNIQITVYSSCFLPTVCQDKKQYIIRQTTCSKDA